MKKQANELSEDKNINNLIKNVMGKSKINLKQLFEEEEKYRWFLIYDDIEYLFPKTKDEINNKNKLKEMVNECIEEELALNWDLKESFINKNIELNNLYINEEEKANDNKAKENNIIKVENDLLNIDLNINNDNNDKNEKNQQILYYFLKFQKKYPN